MAVITFRRREEFLILHRGSKGIPFWFRMFHYSTPFLNTTHSFHSIQVVVGGAQIRHKANRQYFLYHIRHKRWIVSQNSKNWGHWKESNFTCLIISLFCIIGCKPTGRIYFTFMVNVCEKGRLRR
jgi:hypothetical protein